MMHFPPLTDKQQRFWELYCAYADPVRAYKEAYGEKKNSVAKREGNKLLANPKITCRFEKVTSTPNQELNADWIIERLIKIAMICGGEAMNPVTGQKMFDPGYAIRALEILGKCKGVNLFVADVQKDDARYVIEIPTDTSGGDVEKWAKTSRRLDS